MTKSKNTDVTSLFGDQIQGIKDDFQPHNFSKRMCASIENQTDINRAITKIVQDSLSENSSIQEIIKKIMDKHIVYKLGSWTPAILTVIGTVATVVIQWLFK